MGPRHLALTLLLPLATTAATGEEGPRTAPLTHRDADAHDLVTTGFEGND